MRCIGAGQDGPARWVGTGASTEPCLGRRLVVVVVLAGGARCFSLPSSSQHPKTISRRGNRGLSRRSSRRGCATENVRGGAVEGLASEAAVVVYRVGACLAGGEDGACRELRRVLGETTEATNEGEREMDRETRGTRADGN